MWSKKNRQAFAVFIFCFISLSFSHNAFAVTEDEADLFSRQAHEKALAEEKKNNLELSSMYFINALSFKPGHIDVITDYANMIFRFVKNDPTSISMDSLDALETFLNAQVMTVKPDDLPEIVELRTRVSIAREEFIEKNTPTTDTRDDADIVKKIADYKNSAENSSNIQEYLSAMQSANDLAAEYDIEDVEIAEKLQTGSMMSSGMRHVRELIRCSSDPGLAPLQMHYLQLAESSLQQLVALSLNLPSKIVQEILQIKVTLDNRIDEVSEERSKVIFEQVNQEYVALKELNKKSSTYQSKINNINIFMRGIAAKAQGISSLVYSKNLEKIMEEIQTQTNAYRFGQEAQYNIWAVDQMKTALKEAVAYDRTILKAKLRDENKMREIMVNRLCSVDTRLLNFGAQQCFNSTYGALYPKLDEENQRRFDESMAFYKKRSLDEF
jgi:hypothetical protein